MIRRRTLAIVAALALGWSALAPPAAADHHGSDPVVVEVVSTNVQGKNVYVPSTIVVEAGKPHVLSLFNTTDTPHGFSIGSLGIEVILPVQEELRVELPALEGTAVHRVTCHLHPPHRSAQLLVVETSSK